MHRSWMVCVLLAYSRLTLQHNLARNNLPNTAFTTPNPAGDDNNYNNDQVYLLNSILKVSWFTDFTYYSVYLWQQELPGQAAALQGAIFNKSVSDPENGGFSWQVEPGTTDLDVSNVFFLALGQTNSIDGSATSHYFNITANAADIPTSQSSSTSSSPATSTTATTSILSSSSITTSTPASSTTAATNVPGAPASSMTSGSKIGPGVGVGVGVPIILLLAGLVFLKVRNTRGQRKDRGNQYVNPPQQYPMDTSEPAPTYTVTQRYELPAPSKPR